MMKPKSQSNQMPTFREIGETLGISKSIAEQTYKQAIRKLRLKMDRQTLIDIVQISSKYDDIQI